jgi:hypothetical protein
LFRFGKLVYYYITFDATIKGREEINTLMFGRHPTRTLQAFDRNPAGILWKPVRNPVDP